MEGSYFLINRWHIKNSGCFYVVKYHAAAQRSKADLYALIEKAPWYIYEVGRNGSVSSQLPSGEGTGGLESNDYMHIQNFICIEYFQVHTSETQYLQSKLGEQGSDLRGVFTFHYMLFCTVCTHTCYLLKMLSK